MKKTLSKTLARLELDLLPNDRQADLFSRSLEACEKVERFASKIPHETSSPEAPELEDLGDWLRNRIEKSEAPLKEFLAVNRKEFQDIPYSILHEKFTDAMGGPKTIKDVNPELRRLRNGFFLTWPNLADLNPKEQQVRFGDFPDNFGAISCREFEVDVPGSVETVFVFKNPKKPESEWKAKVYIDNWHEHAKALTDECCHVDV